MKKDDRRNTTGFSRKQQNKRNVDSEGREAKGYGEASISRQESNKRKET